MTYAVGIDHQPGILARDYARHADIAGCRVDGDVGNPGRPCRAIAWKFAVNVKRIGKAAAMRDVTFFAFEPRRARLPVRALGDGLDKIDRARVLQIAQAIFD